MSFLKYFVLNILIFSTLPQAQAVVLDWSGYYQVELNTLQNGDFENWGSGEIYHNLFLNPEVKVFDEVQIKSQFYFSSSSDNQKPYLLGANAFRSQEGLFWDNTALPVVAVRDLYLEISHDFGILRLGRKPHHFGLGMYYNASHKPFNSFYNVETSKGSISWRGFIGSSYYVQPMIYYYNETAFSMMIQAGLHNNDNYGVDALYKTTPIKITDDDQTNSTESYFGFYGFYLMDSLDFHLEAGGNSKGVYGGFFKAHWKTPIKWLKIKLNLAGSSSNENTSFYFDPSFSSNLAFFVEQYSLHLQDKEDKKEDMYSFNSGFYISPSASFSITDVLSIKSIFSVILSYDNGEPLFYNASLMLKYKIKEGLVWKTSIGTIFPNNDNWHIGLRSQAAITF